MPGAMRGPGLAALVFPLAALGPAGTLSAGPADAALKAAFVYNFGKFTEWPPQTFASPSSPVILCLAGGGADFAAAFSGIEGKQLQGRELDFNALPRPDPATRCHLLFLAPGELGRAAEWIRANADGPVLTVGDGEAATDAGLVIGLFPAGQHLQFDVNLAAAQRSGLRLSSQLLRLARRVREGKP